MKQPSWLKKIFDADGFNLDLAYNYVSLGVLAVGGVLSNIIISAHYGVATLGAFNQVLAVLFIVSQFAALGLQFSALKYVAELKNDQNVLGKIIWSVVALAMGLGVLASVVVFWLSPFFGRVTNSLQVGSIMAVASFSILFLSVNKVFLRTINGLSAMRQFAVFQALRPVFMVIFLLLAGALKIPANELGWVFVVCEGLLFVFMLGAMMRLAPLSWQSFDLSWVRKHLDFGLRFFMGGLVLETNTRVDVLMLGLMTTDKIVGYYSFAAMIGEGFYQMLTVVRNKVSPMMPLLLKEKRYDELHALVRRVRTFIYPASAAVAALIIITFNPAVSFLLADPGFFQSWIVLCLLLVSAVICSGYIPFTFILFLAGKPGKNTMVFLCALASNIVLNGLLIPFFGLYGAAVATAGASFILVICLKIMVRRELGFAL